MGSERTHDHDIERQEDPAFRPVCLGVRRNVVDEETGTNKEDDFEQICALIQPLPSLASPDRGSPYRRAKSWACPPTSR
jgi:hypothetical protein